MESALNTQFTIIYEKDEAGWWIATIPEVPGAFSQGKTRKQARENAIDALHELMAARRDLALRQKPANSYTEQLLLAG